MADGEVRAEDLTQETAGTLSGDEQFVMFDAVEGKRADIDVISEYMVGDKSTLDTEDKSSIVGAINEVCGDLQNGTFEGLTAGNALQLLGSTYTTDKTPYLYRKSGGGVAVGTREFDTLVGATVAWNQLVQNGNFASTSFWNSYSSNFSVSNNIASITATATWGRIQSDNIIPSIGHKYLLGISVKGTTNNYVSFAGISKYLTKNNDWERIALIVSPSSTNTTFISIGDSSSSGFTEFNVKDCIRTDLTAMFGTTIADYIYSLESATAGAGVAWIKDNYPVLLDYHAYDAGELISTKTSAHKMVGFNQFDKSTITDNALISSVGTLNTGQPEFFCSDYIRVVPNATYYSNTDVNDRVYTHIFYDVDKNFVDKNAVSNNTFTVPQNAFYMRVNAIKSNISADDICINISKTTGTPKNGDYVPYTVHTYTLPNTELRGLFKLDNGKLYADGDVLKSDGKHDTRYTLVDLGTLDWTYAGTEARGAYFWTNITERKKGTNFICQRYTNIGVRPATYTGMDKIIASENPTDLYIDIVDTAYSDATSFKTAMSGVYLVYEKATPTTETGTGFTNPQIVDPDGTEEYIDERTVPVPVGHETNYPTDLVKKIESIPNPPTANGTYVLKATVTGGVATISWEAQ